MPEFVPPPPELHEQLGEFPLAETRAERLAEKIRNWFRYEEPEEVGERGFYTSATGEAVQTVLGRIVLAIALPAVCCLVIYGLTWGAHLLLDWESAEDIFRFLRIPWSIRPGIVVVSGVIAVISGVSSFILPLVDAERKGANVTADCRDPLYLAVGFLRRYKKPSSLQLYSPTRTIGRSLSELSSWLA